VGTASPRKILLEPLKGGKGWSSTHTMVGIADYLTTGSESYPVVLKLETGGAADYFIGFNRATGKIIFTSHLSSHL
jgi:hypothetical protein